MRLNRNYSPSLLSTSFAMNSSSSHQEDSFQEVLSAFETIKLADREDPYPLWKVRAQRLMQLEKLIVENKEALSQSINEDFGHRSSSQTLLLDIYPTLSFIRSLVKDGEGWMKPRNKGVDSLFFPAKGYLLPQPKGVVGIMTTWNYPIYLSLGPTAQAITAGNRVMLKLSEQTPKFSLLMKDLISRYFNPREICPILGDLNVAKKFATLPFDHLMFTGSPLTGKKILAAAAESLTPVTLELGGKSPAVISPSYPLNKAADRILFAKLINAGQTCIAPDYVLVENRSIPRLLGLLKESAQKLFPQAIDDSEYTSVINGKEFDRLVNYLQEVQNESKIENLFAGEQINLANRKLAPQAVVNPPLTSKLMQHEIFGPILPIIGYPEGRMDVAMDFVSARHHPLSIYLFEDNMERRKQFVQFTRCGGMTIDDTLWHAMQSTLPFGGVGNSGMGVWRGKEGFDQFSHLKPVFEQSRFSLITKIDNPLGSKAMKLVQKIVTSGNYPQKEQVLQLVRNTVKNIIGPSKKD